MYLPIIDVFPCKHLTNNSVRPKSLVLSCLEPSSIRGLVASWTSLLHVLLSFVFFNRSSNNIPLHSSMLFIHRIRGLPCFFCSRCSVLIDFFLQTISLFSQAGTYLDSKLVVG